MRRPKRSYLTRRIIELIGLPPGKETEDYFTRQQLIELLIWVENVVEQSTELNRLEIQTNLVFGGITDGSSEEVESSAKDQD